MFIDNTLSVKNFAKTEEANKILNVKRGDETQLFFIGQTVKGNNKATTTQKGIIIDIYCENGYYRYIIEYPINRRKKGSHIFRTFEIELIK